VEGQREIWPQLILKQTREKKKNLKVAGSGGLQEITKKRPTLDQTEGLAYRHTSTTATQITVWGKEGFEDNWERENLGKKDITSPTSPMLGNAGVGIGRAKLTKKEA